MAFVSIFHVLFDIGIGMIIVEQLQVGTVMKTRAHTIPPSLFYTNDIETCYIEIRISPLTLNKYYCFSINNFRLPFLFKIIV